MLSKLHAGLREQLTTGETLICAVSGGADSMALLWGAYLLKDQLGICLEAAHFNHGLRGEESDADALFVKDFCAHFDITLHMDKKAVTAGAKGLEAAARDARYAFFDTLSGKIATAHTADDNAETVLMHLIRGTGLKGLGGISPVRGKIIRPMLNITRKEILEFLDEYSIAYREDSSNAQDLFLRNRIRHRIMPLLLQENPRLKQDLSTMAQNLRDDEAYLQEKVVDTDKVSEFRLMESALQSRAIVRLLQKNGIAEPSRAHISLARQIIYSNCPSARACLPGGMVIQRNYDTVRIVSELPTPEPVVLNCPGVTRFGDILIHCKQGQMDKPNYNCFVVNPKGSMVVRSRVSGDQMRLQGGSKSLKKIFSDYKIPASHRPFVPVIVDDEGVLGVYGVGANLARIAYDGIQICFEKIEGERHE